MAGNLQIKLIMPENSILLIDPSKNLLNAYLTLLQGENCLVDTAMSTGEGFRLFLERHYAILITEYLPPFAQTVHMIQWVKENSPETYVITVTDAIIDDLTYGNLLEIGVDDLILKPYPFVKILAHVKKGFRQRRLLLEKRELEKRSVLEPVVQEIDQPIFNPPYFKKCFHQEFKRAKRHKHPLSLLLMEIPVKVEAGVRFDNLYIELAKILRKYVREEDIVGRENGSFGIILPETDQPGSEAVSKRLSELIKEHPGFQSDDVMKSITRTISFQAYTHPGCFEIPGALKAVVDDADKDFKH